MKLALFADIHSNLEALSACLAHAREQGAQLHAFLGDLVGYGADPVAVLDLIESYVQGGAIVVRGNHDDAVLGRPSDTMNPDAEQAILWTRSRLSERQRDFLSSLPLVVRREHSLFVHASAAAPERWLYVTNPVSAVQSLDAAKATYVFSGHVHEAVLYYIGPAHRGVAFQPVPGVAIPVSPRRRWLAIVGSVGQPRDGSTAARYALADLTAAKLTFFRVPYDFATAAAKVRAAGLPERLALRLERGK